MRLQSALPAMALLASIDALAQQSDPSTLQVLIQEVRQLRMAIEKSSTIVPRMQITLTRFQTQQERVDRIEKDLRTLQAQIANDSSARARMTAALARLDEQLNQQQEAAVRKQLEDAASGMRREIEQQSQREQQLRLQEADLASQFKFEQAKLSELSTQLDQLDHKMQDR